MAGSALMSLGSRAMFAASAGMQVTGHNIANASVRGYSRQQVELQTSNGQFTGAGFFGKGADVASVTRQYDQNLTRQAAATQSQAAHDDIRYEHLQRMETAFPLGESGMGYAASELFNAMADLANRPTDVPSREVVLSQAAEVAARFNASAGQLRAMQSGVTSDLKLEVQAVNDLVGRIAQANDEIAKVSGIGQPPNDLLDQRDRLVHDLSRHLQITTVESNDGTVGVFVAGGQRLVLGTQTTALIVVANPADASRSALGVRDEAGLRVISSEALGSGSIGGLLRFQNDDLLAGREMLDELARSLSDRVNAQQALGIDQDGNAGAPLFTPVVATAGAAYAMRVVITSPRELAAASASGSDNGNALAMAALRDEDFVNTGYFANTTMTDAYSALVGNIGVRVQSARVSSEISGAVAASAEDARASKSGVNLDEEAALLIQYQQAYQAAAKVLQLAQQAFETLLQSGAG
jgi:flagellar hook-associated protein 1